MDKEKAEEDEKIRVEEEAKAKELKEEEDKIKAEEEAAKKLEEEENKKNNPEEEPKMEDLGNISGIEDGGENMGGEGGDGAVADEADFDGDEAM